MISDFKWSCQGGHKWLQWSHQFISSKEEKGDRENAFKVICQMMQTPWAGLSFSKVSAQGHECQLMTIKLVICFSQKPSTICNNYQAATCAKL